MYEITISKFIFNNGFYVMFSPTLDLKKPTTKLHAPLHNSGPKNGVI